jgi:AraC family transcriptional activator of pobA
MKHTDKIPSYNITDIKKKKSFASDFEFYRFEYFVTLQYKELRAYLFFNNVYKQAYLDLDRPSGAHLKILLTSIEQEYLHNRSYSQNIIRSYINIILFELTRVYEQSIPASGEHNIIDDKLREFENLIEKNFKKYHLVTDYATILHITANYLNAISTRRKGKAAGEVIRDRIILEAKRLLTHSDKTITQIAYDLGFEDNSYFGRFFKKYCDQTPAVFRSSQL